MIKYQKILQKNMLNVLIDILIDIKRNGLSNNNHLYITFLTNHFNVRLPEWIKEKYPEEMTIVIQHEYYNLEIKEKKFSITLSFNNIKTNLIIGYDSIISFADPSANFGLILQEKKIQNKKRKNIENNRHEENNIINFSNYKKN
ncbi:ClpXP protease specificity-enhancing factor SspB [Pelagibacteraceae bacterium]|nr:ClpXP protease specificity-enhancing factor SspB [Pelagibacteraceae bacterium]